MHFALARRKPSDPPPYIAPFFSTRRGRTHLLLYILGLAAFLLFLVYERRTRPTRSPFYLDFPTDDPPVLIVTVIDPDTTARFQRIVKQNRRYYADRHGYATFFPTFADYNASYAPSPDSWSKVPALRHALALYPRATYIWLLDANAIITNHSLALHRDLLPPTKLAPHLLLDHPIVPSSGVVRTAPAALPAAHAAALLVAQDGAGLLAGSLVLRAHGTSSGADTADTAAWARFLLDAWFDPLLRSYAFVAAERHALEHLVQWHGSVLARVGVVPARVLAGMTRVGEDREADAWREGDLVAAFWGCQEIAGWDCEGEAAVYSTRGKDLTR